MIEYILNTGSYFTGDNYRNFGQAISSIGSITNSNPLTNDITINGQSLLETSPTISVVASREIINNSGDYFLSGNSLRESTGFLNLDFDSSNLKFDKIRSGEGYFYRDSSNTGLIFNFSGIVGTSLNGDNIFLNGIKLTSGENYVEDGLGNFIWRDSDVDITGLLFSSPIKINDTYTGVFDINRTSFNRGTSVGYLNGVKLDEEDLLETCSNVSFLIQTGFEPNIEFISDINPLLINL